MRTNQRGITLVALVITIIIIIILATVTINMAFGDNGLIKQAELARDMAANSTKHETESMANLTAYMNEMMNEDIDNGGTITEDGVPIPDGFYYVGGSKEEGVVISDNPEDENKGTSHEVAQTLIGNQFVWIPVEEDSLFKRYDGYLGGNLEGYIDYCTEPFANGYDTEAEEYQAMYDSVIENNGFYVGRYEAGTSANSERTEASGIEEEVVVKQGKYVYNWIGWNGNEDNAMNDETGGAVQLAKNFDSANNYTSVTSTLIYGVQWDAIMNFIDQAYAGGNCAEDSFVRDSSDKGWYEQSSPTTTGSNANYAVKNTYDLGGNVYEWTMEAYDTLYRVYRGGSYNYSGLADPASNRSLNYPSGRDDYIGFRLALYVK